MPKKIELNWWDRRLVKKLGKHTEDNIGHAPTVTANAIIETAFPGFTLRRRRKDAGTHKIREEKDGKR